jgi:hypothetical protein
LLLRLFKPPCEVWQGGFHIGLPVLHQVTGPVFMEDIYEIAALASESIKNYSLPYHTLPSQGHTVCAENTGAFLTKL